MCPRGRDAPYEPSTLPGARFPHAALTLLQPGPLNPAGLARVPGCGSEGPGPFVSTLDLVPAAGLGVALFLSAEGGTLGAWLDAAAAAASEAGVPILPIVVAASEQSAAAAKGTVDGRAALALAADNGWEAVRGVGAQVRSFSGLVGVCSSTRRALQDMEDGWSLHGHCEFSPPSF